MVKKKFFILRTILRFIVFNIIIISLYFMIATLLASDLNSKLHKAFKYHNSSGSLEICDFKESDTVFNLFQLNKIEKENECLILSLKELQKTLLYNKTTISEEVDSIVNFKYALFLVIIILNIIFIYSVYIRTRIE